MDSVTITFRTTEDIKKKLDNIALDQNRTLSNMIETIIIKWLEEYEKKAQDKNWAFLVKKQYYFLVLSFFSSITSFKAVPNVATPESSAGTIILVDLPSAKCSRAS